MLSYGAQMGALPEFTCDWQRASLSVLYHNGYDVQGCDETGIKYFCMHALRHTYATCAIESDMHPKTPNAETS